MTFTRSKTANIASQISERVNIPVTAKLAVRFAFLVTKWDERYKMRRELNRLPNYRLEDIGMTAAQASKEVRKPFWRA